MSRSLPLINDKPAKRATRKRKPSPPVTGTPTLWIDDRAGSRDLVKHHPLTECGELCRLVSGDVLVVGNGPTGAVTVGVEVKSVFDLISSIDTGRLQATQIPTMLEHYDYNWLLHYGLYRPATNGALEVYRKGMWQPHSIGERLVPYGYLESYLFEFGLLGVRVKRVANMEEAAHWLGCLARYWGKPWEKHKKMRAFDWSGDIGLLPTLTPQEKRRARFAAQVPGLGFERAVAAALHFPTVVEMVLADESEWASVKGVGKVLAKVARQTFYEGG